MRKKSKWKQEEQNPTLTQKPKTNMRRLKTYSSLVTCNGNLLASIDLETTGTQPGYHEIIQIAVVPLNSDIRPNNDLPVFYQNIKPKRP